MRITPETVERVASLAALDLTAAEKEELARVLTRILDYVERISEVPVEGVQPLANPWIDAAPARPDEVHPWPDPAALVAKAAVTEGGAYRVPLVVDKT